MISRRNFLSRSAALTLPFFTAAAASNDSVDKVPFQEIRDALLLDVSDKNDLCLFGSKHPFETFHLSRGFATRERHPRSESVQVVPIGSPKPLFSIQPRNTVWFASFFRGSDRLYMESLVFRDGRDALAQHLVLDLQTGASNEYLSNESGSGPWICYYALYEQMMLATEANRDRTRLDNTGRQIQNEAILRITLPEYKEIQRAPFLLTPKRNLSGYETGLMISGDRKKFIYGFDDTIVCRRTEDLQMVWTTNLEPEFSGAWQLPISTDGGFCAAALLNRANDPYLFLVRVYDGEDGSLIAQLPLDATQGLAISQDGKLIAVGEQAHVGKNVDLVELGVSFYEIPSGKKVGRIVHERFPFIDRGGLNTFSKIQFTPDGKYLVTCRTSIKVWQVSSVV